MTIDLRQWFSEEIERRGWSQREFARRAGLTQSLAFRTLRGDRDIDANFCIQAARAFEEPPEKVLRMAGILDPLPDAKDEIAEELLRILDKLSPEAREEVLRYARYTHWQERDS